MNRHIWVFRKDGAGVESSEYIGGKQKKGLTFDQFVDTYEKLDTKEKEQFRQKTEKWDKDYTGHSVHEIRTAGLTETEQQSDPEKKNILLASQYLQRDKKNPKLFRADFKGNYLAEYKAIGWGHVFPDTVESIKVSNQIGEVICDKAVRGVSPTGKEGYFDAAGMEKNPPEYQYIFMYTGFTAEVLKTITPEEAEAKRKLQKDKVKAIQRSSRLRDATLGSFLDLPTPPGVPKPLKGPGTSIDANLAFLEQQTRDAAAPIESAEVRDGRKKIVDIAMKYAGSNRFDADFKQYEMLKGGNLGCAWVASTILREAGYLNQTIPGVDGVKEALTNKGLPEEKRWREANNEQPEPGDVVIWERLPGKYVQKGDGDASWQPGHKHIGIVIGPNLVVDNRSGPPAGPKAGPLFRPGRGIEAILKPPKTVKAESVPSSGAVQGKANNGEHAPNPKSLEKPLLADGIAHHTSAGKQKVSLETMVSDHRENAPKLQIQARIIPELKRFREKVLRNKQRYDQVAAGTGVPWYLIAALHMRESGGSFNTYLHNGDPLGKPTVHVPKGKLFYDWETAAIDAINSMGITQKLGLTPETTDMGLLLAYAEKYNGLGYRRPELGTTSPYVYAGTNMYAKGKYVRDGVYDPNVVDQQLGVAAMITALTTPDALGPVEKNKAVA